MEHQLTLTMTSWAFVLLVLELLTSLWCGRTWVKPVVCHLNDGPKANLCSLFVQENVWRRESRSESILTHCGTAAYKKKCILRFVYSFCIIHSLITFPWRFVLSCHLSLPLIYFCPASAFSPPFLLHPSTQSNLSNDIAFPHNLYSNFPFLSHHVKFIVQFCFIES